MIGYDGEESIDHWTRGSLTGEWQLSDYDVIRIFSPLIMDSDTQIKAQSYCGSAMQLRMTTPLAMAYNWKYRQEQARKMRVIPWDTNLLNAFHNLHFICYMADKLPDFSTKMQDGQIDYIMDVPGRQMWMLELVMKAATECLRDDFIKQSKEDKGTDYRVTPRTSDEIDGVGFTLHITGDCIFNIWLEFHPTIKDDGTFGCDYSVNLSAETWHSRNVPIYGSRASKNPLRQNMLAMASYLKKELKRFSKMLENADFNQPENSLVYLLGQSDSLYPVFKKLIKKYGLKEGWYREDYNIKKATIHIGSLDYELMRYDCTNIAKHNDPLCVFAKVSVVDKKLRCGNCYYPMTPKNEADAEKLLVKLLQLLETTFDVKLIKG